MITLPSRSYFENGVLYHGWNYGFFSNLSTCLWNLCLLKDRHGIEPERIDFSRSFAAYKTEKNLDLYPMLFRRRQSATAYCKPGVLKHHVLYRQEDIRPLLYFVNRYFLPAEPVMELQKKLRDKYNIEIQNTLVLCMRGTNKLVEIRSASPRDYFLQCEKILSRNPGLRIWVQTDQKQYLDYFLKKYSKKAFFISELPVSAKYKAIHLENNIEINRFEFAQQFLAATHLMAQCKSIVTHTGNVGYWHAIYRGHLNDFYQDITHFCGNDLAWKIQNKLFYQLPIQKRKRIADQWWVRLMLKMSKGHFYAKEN